MRRHAELGAAQAARKMCAEKWSATLNRPYQSEDSVAEVLGSNLVLHLDSTSQGS